MNTDKKLNLAEAGICSYLCPSVFYLRANQKEVGRSARPGGTDPAA
jgi:hypothetical protein